MKNLLFICLALVSIISCDDLDNLDRIEGMGPIIKETIEVQNFTGIELDAPIRVTITQGDELALIAEGHQNIIDRLRTQVKNDRLDISLENGNYRDFKLELFITVPDLNYLSVDGAGKFKVGAFEAKEMRCYIDGAGKLDFESTLVLEQDLRIDIDGAADTYIQDLTAENVLVNVDGKGDITLRGTTDVFEVRIDGLGDVEAFALESKEVKIRVDGLGKTEVTAVDELDVNIDGIGNVYYKGEPTIYKEIDGIGRLFDAN